MWSTIIGVILQFILQWVFKKPTPEVITKEIADEQIQIVSHRSDTHASDSLQSGTF